MNTIDSRLVLSNALRPGALTVADNRTRFSRVMLSPSVLSALVPIAVTSADGTGVPAASSQQGSLFDDGGDPQAHWYLPQWSLAPAPDGAFGFAAVRDGLSADGQPFNTAGLTLGLVKQVPADAQAAIAAAAEGATYTEIPLTGLAAGLRLVVKDAAGNDVNHDLPGTVTITDATATVTFPLLGPDVIVGYEALAAGKGASLELTASYTVVRWSTDAPVPRNPFPLRLQRVQEAEVLPPPLVDPPHVEVRHVEQPPIEQPRVDLPAALRMTAVTRFSRSIDLPRIDTMRESDMLAVEPVELEPTVLREPPPNRIAVRETATSAVEVPVGTAYSSPSYKPLFTLQEGTGAARGIVSADDLVSFEAPQSEYVELTALGPVADRYPSFRALYLGQVSGTVVAIPAEYGLARRADGVAARCDAIVDPSSSSGCRFQLTFGLAPVVDPGELAQLQADLAAEPTLRDRVERLSLPTDLDPRHPSSLGSANLASPTFTIGDNRNDVIVTAAVVDDDVPAVMKVNLVLSQLADPMTTSLVGSLALRLDDGYAEPVTSAIKLDLGTTAGDDDLSIVLGEDGIAHVSNLSPHPLTITSLTVHAGSAFTRSVPGTALPAGGTTDIPVPDGTDLVLAACALDLGAGPVSAEGYVAVHAETTTVVHHVFGFNAAGQLAPDISQVRIRPSLTSLPDLQLPEVTLTPQSAVDSISADLPVLYAVTGVAAELAVTVTPADGAAYDLTLQHDFTAHPVLVLTREALARPTP